MKSSMFVIENTSADDVTLYVEPEGHVVTLAPEESVVVKDEFDKAAVVLRLSKEPDGGIALSIWPGDGDTVVLKNGKDVLDDLWRS